MGLSQTLGWRLTLRSTQRKPIPFLPMSQARHLLKVPLLRHYKLYEEKGISGLYDKQPFMLAWTNYQSFLIKKLNALTAGTPDETATARELAIKYARWSDKSAIFNHASAAYNNHQFFMTITHETSKPDPRLLKDITYSFSSLSSLKAEMIAAANAMFGPGYVWLIQTLNDKRQGADLRLLCTYLAGSPLSAAHWRHQPVDMSTETTNISANDNAQTYAKRLTHAFAMQNLPKDHAVGTAGSIGIHRARNPLHGVGAREHVVLLGVSTWEHTWIRQEGIGGKEIFLKKWWDRIDWDEVGKRRDEAEKTLSAASKRPNSYSDNAYA